MNIYTIIAFFSLLTVVFLARRLVNFLTLFRLVPATDTFIMLVTVFSPIGLV